jgi:hypothetical protein
MFSLSIGVDRLSNTIVDVSRPRRNVRELAAIR